MSVSIGFVIGPTPRVRVIEERDGEEQETEIDPQEFLEKTGLGIYFFQLKPEMKKWLKSEVAKTKRPQKKKEAKAS